MLSKKIILVLLVIGISSCASSILIKNDFNNTTPGSELKKYNIVLVNISDNRKSIRIQKLDKYTYSKDGSFSQPLMGNLTDKLAQHLKTISSVNNIVIDEKTKLSSNDIRLYKEKGFHLYIEIEMNIFYGYQQKTPRFKKSLISTFGGPLGRLFGSETIPLEYGGEVSYSNVKLISVAHDKLLWEGVIENTMEGKGAFHKRPKGYALETLKGTNNKLALKIKNILVNLD